MQCQSWFIFGGFILDALFGRFVDVIDLIADFEKIVSFQNLLRDMEETRGLISAYTSFTQTASPRRRHSNPSPSDSLPAAASAPERLRAGSAGCSPCRREALRGGGNHPGRSGVRACVAWRHLKGQQLKPFKHFCAPTMAFRGSAPRSRLESRFWSGIIEPRVCGAIRTASSMVPPGRRRPGNPNSHERLLYGSHFSTISITDRR